MADTGRERPSKMCFYVPGATHAQDVAVEKDGEWFGVYSGDNQQKMLERTGAVLMLWDDAGTAMIEAARVAHVKPAKLINDAEYMRALEVLPPERWKHNGAVQFFHVSEKIVMNLVNWYGRFDGYRVTFVESCNLTDEQMVACVRLAVATLR